MQLLSHFMVIVSLILGTQAIYSLVLFRKKFNEKKITPYIYALMGINLVSLFQVGETLLQIIRTSDQFPTLLVNALYVSSIFLGLVRFWIAQNIFRFFFLITAHRRLKLFDRITAATMIVFCGLHISVFVNESWGLTMGPWLNTIPHYVFSFLLISASVQAEYLSRELIAVPAKKSLRILGRFIGLFAILAVIILMAVSFRWTNQSTAFILGISLTLCFNALHLPFSRKLFTSLLIGGRQNQTTLSDLSLQFGLTERENEIITLIFQGKTNKEIGDQLYLSFYTVRDYTSSIYRKAGVKNRTQLTALFEQVQENLPKS